MDQNINTLNFEETYLVFKNEDDSSSEYKDIEQKVKYGININFYIEYLFKSLGNAIKIKDMAGKVIIRKKVYEYDEFWEEISEREKLMKKFLNEKYNSNVIAKIRGVK